jgi:hypothetical protein
MGAARLLTIPYQQRRDHTDRELERIEARDTASLLNRMEADARFERIEQRMNEAEQRTSRIREEQLIAEAVRTATRFPASQDAPIPWKSILIDGRKR